MTPSLNVTFASMEVQGYQPQLVITRKAPDPVLSIRSSGVDLTLAWPVEGSQGWVLEHADHPAGPWTASTISLLQEDDQWRGQTTITSTRGFFRLAKYWRHYDPR